MLRRTLPRLASVKDGAARHAAKGDEHFPSLGGHPAACVNAREAAKKRAALAAAEQERKERGGKAATVKEFQVYRCPVEPGRPRPAVPPVLLRRPRHLRSNGMYVLFSYTW